MKLAQRALNFDLRSSPLSRGVFLNEVEETSWLQAAHVVASRTSSAWESVLKIAHAGTDESKLFSPPILSHWLQPAAYKPIARINTYSARSSKAALVAR